MPWSSPVDERRQFILDVKTGIWSFSALCERYGISRQNGYKWLRRYEEHGDAGLYERSRAPKSCPHKTSPEIEALIIAARKARPTWGGGALVGWIAKKDPTMAPLLPAASTAHEILVRHGMIKRRRKRRGLPPTNPPVTQPKAPNDVWTIDFKGDFRTRDGKRCYPLTMADDFSRFLLVCKTLPSTSGSEAKPYIEAAFRKFGLPEVIRSDNGTPFASVGLGRLSRLSVWWIRLGIRIERIQPGKPTQNARHERMHKTLKRDTAKPPAGDARAQQRAFNTFIDRYNHEKPHKAHGGRTPSDFYCTSYRPYPEQVPQPEYPGFYEVRKVSHHGYVRLRGHQFFLSNTLGGEYVGLHEVHDDLWSIDFGNVELARYDVATKTMHTGGAQPVRVLNASDD